jgi:VacB/RNase II family 3'-5' exoribonuclease
MTARRQIERAFHRVRAELGIRTEFPPEVISAAGVAASASEWRSERREDLTALPFVTIDPPGSRDLDQAVHLERGAAGLRVRYAIADVAAFVEPGSVVEDEAWRRGVTYYSPDRRDPLYPPVLSQGAASLLPDDERPAIVFDLRLDGEGELVETQVCRGVVRSRAQLTYHQALDHIETGSLRTAEFATSLALLRDVGEVRIERERARGGVSLPILDQHVERSAARRLGYELVYETPNVAESWNAQISLLAGHAAALRMGRGGVGLLRTMPAPRDADIEKLRVAARALGFDWPAGASYAAFLHGVAPTHPNLQVLVWQARRLMRGAGYVAFAEPPTELAEHSAIALPYAHCTAPLRRLADRYVLDLLVTLEKGESPSAAEVARLQALPAAMDEAGRRAGRLERRVLDIAEAWELRERVGAQFGALILDARENEFEAQLEEVPVRARVSLPAGAEQPQLGQEVAVRLTRVELEEGRAEFEMVE